MAAFRFPPCRAFLPGTAPNAYADLVLMPRRLRVEPVGVRLKLHHDVCPMWDNVDNRPADSISKMLLWSDTFSLAPWL